MAPQIIHNLNDLVLALTMLSANDTKLIKKSEKMLKTFLKTPANASYLVLILRNHTSEVAVRHHAALLLKKKIGKFYAKYPPQQQAELKTELLSLLVNEPEAVIATGIAGIIAVTAKAIFAAKQTWDELFQLLMTLTVDPNERHRALNFKLLQELAEHISAQLQSHTPIISQMFLAGFQDGNQRVYSSALSGINAFIQSLGDVPEVMAFAGVIKPMMALLGKAASEGDEEMIVEGLDVLQECVTLEQPLINEHLQDIVSFCLTILSNASTLEGGVRASAAQTLMDIIENRPKLFAKMGLVNQTLVMLMEILAQDTSKGSLFALPHVSTATEESDEDEEEEEVDIARLAQAIIDAMALHIPSKHFLPTALALCSQGISSPQANMRKAACAVLGVIAEGCGDGIREQLGGILPVLIGAVSDPEVMVRECAVFALGQFSEHCQPDILHHHPVIIPAILQALGDEVTVQCTACYVVEYFVEGLQVNTLRPHLRDLLEKLVGLMRTDKRALQEMCLSAMAAVAVASESDFIPYTAPVCSMLAPFLSLTEPTDWTLRGRTLECWGHIAVAVGQIHFREYFPLGLTSAMEGARLDDTSLTEHCFVFIANAAKAMKDGFVSPNSDLLAQIVPYIVETIQESELIEMVDEDEEDDEEEHHEGGADHEGGDDDDSVQDIRLNVEEGFINTKKAALTALGALVEHTGPLFVGYLGSTLNVLLDDEACILGSIHESIRAEALSILAYYPQALLAAKGVAHTPIVVDVLEPELSYLLIQIVAKLINCLTEDDSKLPVASACDALVEILGVLGVWGLQVPIPVGESKTVMPALQAVLQGLQVLLKGEAECQKAIESVDNSEDDHDTILIDSVTDLLSKVSSTAPKATLVDFFPVFFDFLLAYCGHQSPSDRSMAVGCLAEIFAALGPNTLAYVPRMLKVLEISLKDTLESVRRNAAFCLHVIITACGEQLRGEHNTFLQWLHPLCSRTVNHSNLATVDSLGADTDNALSAVCAMINVNPSLPLDQILPVVCNALPLRGDASEGPVIYRLLAELVVAQHPVLLSTAWDVATYPSFLSFNEIADLGAKVPLLYVFYALFVQVLSGNSNAIDETKTIALSALREAAAKGGDFAQALGSYVGALRDEAFKAHLMEQLR